MKKLGLVSMFKILLITAALLVIAALSGNKVYYDLVSLVLKIETGIIVAVIIMILVNEFGKTQRLPY